MFVMLIMVTLVTIFFSCRKSENGSKAPKEPNMPVAATIEKVQILCPVEGRKIDKSVYVDYQGKRIYFCCADCIAKFNGDQAKFTKQMEEKGVVLANTPQ